MFAGYAEIGGSGGAYREQGSQLLRGLLALHGAVALMLRYFLI